MSIQYCACPPYPIRRQPSTSLEQDRRAVFLLGFCDADSNSSYFKYSAPR